jgi:hypothetical protein
MPLILDRPISLSSQLDLLPSFVIYNFNTAYNTLITNTSLTRVINPLIQ